MTPAEYEQLCNAFSRAAFYYDNGVVYRPTKLKEVEAIPCIVVTHHNWSHEWHKDYLGVVFLAELSFHKHKGIQYLHNVTPVRMKDGKIIKGKMIRAECIRVLD